MMQCPQCANVKEFAIDAITSSTAYVTQHQEDGAWYEAGDLEVIETRGGDLEWDDASGCRCLKCHYCAQLRDFDAPAEV